MAKFLSGREPYFRVGIESATEDLTSFSVVGNSYFTGIITASQFIGDGSLLTGIVASGVGITISDNNIVVGTAFDLNFGQGIDVTPVSSGIVTIFSSYAPVAGISSYAEVAGVSTYASVAGLATYAEVAGVSTYASVAGLATYAEVAGVSTYASVAGIATYAQVTGIATYAQLSGIATYASIAGVATYASIAGLATYSNVSGVSTYASVAGIATYAQTAGIATYASVAGIATIASGLSSTSSINTSGIITATKFVGNGSGLVGVALSNIDDIGDVDIPAIQPASDGRVLIYQNGKWVAGPKIGGYYYSSNTDANFSNVALLLHMDGSNGSTTFTDSSNNVHSVGIYGNTQISTNQNKFGGASAYFDGNGDYLSVPSSVGSLFNVDFTVEMWIKTTSTTRGALIGRGNGLGTYAPPSWALTINESVVGDVGFWSNDLAAFNVAFVTTGANVSDGQWHHIALVRSSSFGFRIYVDGVQRASYSNFTLGSNASSTFIGASGNTGWNYSGYIDELRVTLGFCRYTSNFTPPSTAFGVFSEIYTIDNLDDVNTSSTTALHSQALVWDSSTSLWKPGNVSYALTSGISTYASVAGIASFAVGFGTTASINTTGIITAARFFGDGSNLSGVVGLSSQWVTTPLGIHTLSNVGIGTTRPLYNLHVNGEVVVSGGTSTTQHIKIKGYEQDGGALSFEGSSGQLLSISNNLTGDIFGVNDISGTPIILANSNGRVVLSPYSGNVGLGTTNPTSKLHVIGNGLFSGVITATRYFGDGSQLTGISAGISTYAAIAGVATYAQTAGIATYASTAGIATYATSSGVSTYASTAGIATYASRSGVSTYALLAGISTIARTLDIDSSVFTSGIITASKFVGDGSSLTGIATVLDGISDVNIAAIQPASDGRALIYQNGEWVSGPVIGGYNYNTSDPYINNVSLLMHMNGSNGSTTFIDSGANSGINTITVFGNAQISTAQSKFGGASAYFDGSGDYINIQDNPNFQFGTGDFTIECWFNATGLLVNYPTLLGNGNPSFSGSGSTGSWYLMVSGSPRKINVGTNTTNPIISSTTTINTGSWYHVALVRSGSSVYLFVNGALEAITTNTQSLNISNNGLRIGSNGWDGSQAFWYGYIDDVRVTKGIARYVSNFTLPTAPYPDPTDTNFNNVSLLLHMDGSNGSTTFTDSSSSALTVTPNGNVAISTAQSKFGGSSAYFDGSGDYISIPYSSNFAFGSGNFTIEMWVYRTGSNVNTSRLWSAGGDVFGEVEINIDSSGYLTSFGTTNGTSWNAWSASSIALINLNTWTHIALVRNNTTVTMFVDGVGTVLTLSLGGSSLTPGAGGSSIRTIGGQNTPDRPLSGYIDEIRVTKGFARYTSNFTPQNYPFPNSVGVSTSLGYVINNLDDVDTFTTAPANGQSLIWDASNSVWKPSSVLYSSNAGIATYANNAGIATNTIGGIVNVSNLNVSGITTLGVVGATQINSVGVVTALKFVGDGSLLTGVIPSSTAGINISDDNVNVGVALTVNFGRNLTASQASAGIVTVTTPVSSPTGVSKNTKSFTATSGQTVFSTNYNVGQINVFLNGIRLSESEYIADNGTSIILNEGASLNDLIEVVSDQILFIPFGDYGDFSAPETDAFGSVISPTFDALVDPAPILMINDLGELP